jgi:hypothetical protein
VVEQRLVVEFGVLACVVVGNDHDVTGVVRTVVENDEGVRRARYDAFVSVVFGIAHTTEDTVVLLFLASNPLDSPRREDLFHGRVWRADTKTPSKV